MNPRLDEALRLAGLGYRVFPLTPGDKRPWQGSRGVLEATTDPDRIRAWWAAVPASNIGLATGGGFIVLDLDDPAAAAACDSELSGFPSAATPRGGRHYFMRVPPGRWPNTVKRISASTDTRGDGGYVVAPPSANGVGGWAWLTQLSEPADALPEAPAYVLAALAAPKPDSTAYGRRALDDEADKIRGAPEGRRNDTLNTAAFRVGQLVASCQVEPAEAEGALLAAAIAAGLPEREAAATIRSGLGGGAQHPREPRPRAAPPLAPPTPPAPEAVTVDLNTVDPQRVEWLWPGRVPRGCLTLLAGMPGCGKSFITLDAAARVSTGRAWPDGAECPAGRVLLISAEDDLARTVVPRLIACGADRSNITALQATRGPDGRERGFTLADVDVLEGVLASRPGVELVVIDPIGSYIGGDADAHRDNEVRSVLAPVAEIANRHGVAVLMVAHTRKSASLHADDSVLGSRAFTGIARSVLHVARDPDGDDETLVYLAPGKCNLAPPSPTLAFRINGDPPRVEWETAPVNVKADDLVRGTTGKKDRTDTALDEAKRFILDALATGPIPSSDLTERGEAEGHTEKALKRARRELGVVALKNGYQGAWVSALPGWEIAKGDKEFAKGAQESLSTQT